MNDFLSAVCLLTTRRRRRRRREESSGHRLTRRRVEASSSVGFSFFFVFLMMEKVPCTSSCCEWRGSLFRARCVFVMCISFIWPPTPVPSRSSQHHNKKKRLARRIIITDLSLIAFHPVLHPLSSRLFPPPPQSDSCDAIFFCFN